MNKPSLKIIFAGTPEFAVPSLTALINSSHQVLAVLTQPDRPAGRGQKITESPIKILAKTHQLTVLQPSSLKDPALFATLQNIHADLMIVIAYGLLVPKVILDMPVLGCVNVHASLLPRWRGAAPIQYAILKGDSQTGVTIMQMDEGLDTGAILQQKACNIYHNDTAQSLHDRLALLGAEELLLTLDLLAKKQIRPQPQNHAQATYAPKITKAEGKIAWQNSAIDIDRKIRAFNPWPIAYTTFREETIRVWQAEIMASTTQQIPGSIIKVATEGIEVATGAGILRLLVLQFPGSKPLLVKDILNARANFFGVGDRFNL